MTSIATDFNVRSMSDADLVAAIERGCSDLISGIVLTSTLAVEAKRRGLRVKYPLPHLEGMLIKIGTGKMLPEVLVEFASSQKLIHAVGCLELDDQKAILETRKVEVAIPEPDGTIGDRVAILDPEKLTRDQVSRVFSNGKIRSPKEQAEQLKKSPPVSPRRQAVAMQQQRTGPGILVMLPDKVRADLRFLARKSCLGEEELARKLLERALLVMLSPKLAGSIDPKQPTEAKPGSLTKLELLTARYESGVPLWNGDDNREARDPASVMDEELVAITADDFGDFDDE